MQPFLFENNQGVAVACFPASDLYFVASGDSETITFATKHQCMRRDVFQAIADPTRRQILQLLSRQQLTLNGVTEHFEMSRPAISKHIRILTECGLVSIKQQGRERYCFGELGKLREVADWLKPYQDFWNNKMDDLERFLDAGTEKKSKSKK